KDMIFTIGENMSIRRFVIVEGTVATYVHGMGSTGVIVKVEADEAAKSNADFNETVKNVALQIAAGSPPAYVAKEDVPANVIEEEKTVLINQAKNDPKNAGKPEQVLEKMVLGRLGKFYSANCLLEQEYVKDDSLTVGKYVQQAAKAFGGSIKIVSFVIFEKGEGIEKREEDFAAEIAKMVNKD
ncbi:MAG: translation elongation factor Ts, partial [Clostridia bacterium]|nr:translation elongation factor Ts [Clostridia bacterium]